MGKLDARQCFSDRGASAFDHSMILLNEIVEVTGYSSSERTSNPPFANSEGPGDSA
jgi:hypothetical protein